MSLRYPVARCKEMKIISNQLTYPSEVSSMGECIDDTYTTSDTRHGQRRTDKRSEVNVRMKELSDTVKM